MTDVNEGMKRALENCLKELRFLHGSGLFRGERIMIEGEAALAQAGEAQETWRDISSAPKDGTAVLLYWKVGENKIQAIGRWTKKDDKFVWGWWTDGNQWPNPELWQPKPQPPKGV